MEKNSASQLQDVINDSLFPQVQHTADVKQVLDFMRPVTQPLRQEQVQAILYLSDLGNNRYIHPNGNPYEDLIKSISSYRQEIADPEFYIDTIEALVPKPPKPILMTGDGTYKKIKPEK
ncbi:hypothetical protein [Rhodococcus rhodochrous]|uniref:hypothetical protein n=1 Tax=Rhodococcus rhodochrous TaxID=1829 RepID=UPI000363A4A0|nr:hypothetical protein [Rhodococcus rhodochrous]